jgi:ABC-type multidrug transport system fused ATPase/permease subunit
LPLLTPRPDSGYGYNQAPIFLGNLKFKDILFQLTVIGLRRLAKPWPLWVLGAGKSTIINLLNRFYEIDSGEICIDNQNIERYTLE